MKSKFVMECAAGTYEANSFLKLVIEVVSHRLWHLRKHGKWMD